MRDWVAVGWGWVEWDDKRLGGDRSIIILLPWGVAIWEGWEWVDCSTVILPPWVATVWEGSEWVFRRQKCSI